MKGEALQYLKLSLLADTNTLKTATQMLTQMSRQPSYCMIMMEITDDQSLDLGIRQAALVQLKNTIKKYWNSTQNPISNEQKTAIVGALLPAFIQSSNSFPLLKIYKQIVSNIIGHVYQSWFPIQILCAKLNTNQNSIAVLHFIIAIQTNFQMSIDQKQRNFYYQFIKAILPTIFNFVQNQSSQEVIYLAMKIIWKIVHYQISHEIRNILCEWMNLILAVVGASNQQIQANLQQTQVRGSTQFFYFHAKKWATRILHRFIIRHANGAVGLLLKQDVKKLNQQFSKFWYEKFGQKVVQQIVKQFLVPSIKKTRYFQLKCLTQLVNQHPQQMRQYYESFQYKILPPYLQLQPEDQQLANNDPLQFINREGDLSFSNTFLKRQAKEAWVAFANIGAKKKKKNKPQQVGPLFIENMKWIKSKLEGSNRLQKQMAMYLICQLRISIKNSEQMMKILPSLIAQFVVPQFTSQTMFLRARSMQIFDEYGDLLTDKAIIKKAVQGIYFCLTQDNYPLVRLKAATAFHVLLQHQEARQQVKPLFEQILKIYLILMEKYDSQSLVFSLSGIVQHFGAQVGPYACQLMKYLSKHFIKLFTKDKIQSEDPDYDGETELAASGVLGTITTLLQSAVDQQSIKKMQADVLDVCDFVFSCDDVDYIEDVISVLRAYTSKVTFISQGLLFYYVLLIYYITGIQKQLWDKIPLMAIPEIKKKCLNCIRSGCNIESLDSVMLVLRNFISIDSSVLLKYTDPFGINLLELLFSMVNQIYQRGPNQYDGEVQMNSCTILMVYLLENNHKKWDDNMLSHIWQVVKHNLQKAQSKGLKSINAQLIGVLLWNNCVKTMMLAQSNNLLRNMMVCLLDSEFRIKEQHQRQRIILGISQIISQPNKPQEIIEYLPKLFKLVIELVKKNCDFRLNDDNDQHYETQSQDEQAQIHLNLDDEPQDIWQEDYNKNYVSKLQQVDEIKLFKQSIQKLQNEQPVLYNQLISLIPLDELNLLDQKINRAIQFGDEVLNQNKKI